MFRSVYGSFDHSEKNDKGLSDGQGEAKQKPAKTSAVGKREPNEGLEDVAHSATLNAHHDGSYSVDAEDGLTKHDSYESASEHMSKSVNGDAEGMDKDVHGSMKSKLAPKGPKDNMSGASGM
jgi:hypothetical protein